MSGSPIMFDTCNALASRSARSSWCLASAFCWARKRLSSCCCLVACLASACSSASIAPRRASSIFTYAAYLAASALSSSWLALFSAICWVVQLRICCRCSLERSYAWWSSPAKFWRADAPHSCGLMGSPRFGGCPLGRAACSSQLALRSNISRRFASRSSASRCSSSIVMYRWRAWSSAPSCASAWSLSRRSATWPLKASISTPMVRFRALKKRSRRASMRSLMATVRAISLSCCCTAREVGSPAPIDCMLVGIF
mmetsp:Transcript_5159/g.12086  ORF Transcript_5159/g.12086 Transcript_5159/m.12086 type:complete len:255 (-) Transcript_5159:56-820(-)